MSQLGIIEAGNRHDLHIGISPDAPDASEARDEADGAFGYAHSYETSSRYDGPGLRVCFSYRAVCFAAPTATIPIPGI
jgi:pyruvate formate lyase activating enzyme